MAVVLLDACFWVVCLVLVASGATKLVDPAPFARVLGELRVGGPRAVTAHGASARAVGALEIAAGLVGLSLGGRWIAGAVALSYGSFTVVVLVARTRGLNSCGCFGERSGPPSLAHAALNAASAAVAGVGVVRAPEPIADALSGRGVGAAALVLAVLAAACAVVVVDTRSPRTTVPSTSTNQGD